MAEQREVTYLRLHKVTKRRAKMAAAGLGVTLSDLVDTALLREVTALGVRDIAGLDDVDQEEREEGQNDA